MFSPRRASVALAAAGSMWPATLAAGHAAPRHCPRLFTVWMGERAARAVYSRPGRVTLHQLRVLGYIERCQRNPRAQGFVRSFDRRLARRHALRARLASAPHLAYGQWAIPARIVMCESGGQNLPPNSAGASGYYQIMPGTWEGYGGQGTAAYLASKAEQDTIAARIWDGGNGASQWVCKA